MLTSWLTPHFQLAHTHIHVNTQEFTTAEGRKYWNNSKTSASVWEEPAAFKAIKLAKMKLAAANGTGPPPAAAVAAPVAVVATPVYVAPAAAAAPARHNPYMTGAPVKAAAAPAAAGG